jgi:hypothetical protein
MAYTDITISGPSDITFNGSSGITDITVHGPYDITWNQFTIETNDYHYGLSDVTLKYPYTPNLNKFQSSEIDYDVINWNNISKLYMSDEEWNKYYNDTIKSYGPYYQTKYPHQPRRKRTPMSTKSLASKRSVCLKQKQKQKQQHVTIEDDDIVSKNDDAYELLL